MYGKMNLTLPLLYCSRRWLWLLTPNEQTLVFILQYGQRTIKLKEKQPVCPSLLFNTLQGITPNTSDLHETPESISHQWGADAIKSV